ncbi:MAG: DUF2334 domain-containing protein [Mangrovibacterium sp.]
MAENIQLIFRYDDFVFKTDSLHEQVVLLFKKHNIPLVLGVIPADYTENMILEPNYPFLPLLGEGVQNGSIEIAQHGLNHKELANGEFGNVDFDEQVRRLKKGKVYLESVFKKKTVTFIPPWNAYDENTLTAMESLGFRVISSSLSFNQPSGNSSIIYLPHTIGHPGQLESILKNNKNRTGIVVLMFHRYDLEKDYNLERLNSLLSRIKKMDYVQCQTFAELANSKIVDGKRFKANLEVNFLTKLLDLKNVIYPANYVLAIRITNLLLHLVISYMLYFVSLLIAKIDLINISKPTGLLFGVILFFCIGLGVWFHLFGPKKLILVSVLLSIWPLYYKIDLLLK